jgi:hypothetical protein
MRMLRSVAFISQFTHAPDERKEYAARDIHRMKSIVAVRSHSNIIDFVTIQAHMFVLALGSRQNQLCRKWELCKQDHMLFVQYF